MEDTRKFNNFFETKKYEYYKLGCRYLMYHPSLHKHNVHCVDYHNSKVRFTESFNKISDEKPKESEYEYYTQEELEGKYKFCYQYRKKKDYYGFGIKRKMRFL